MKKIKTNINIFNRHFSAKFKKGISFIYRLEFMESKDVNISIFNRYLILFIVFLFSYLFYLSLPTIYNYGILQKDLNKKLLKEFNLNSALSADITYKILPSPNFEIKNVLLNSNSNNQLEEYAQIKKMKIYISSKNLFDQKKLQIKKIVISEANIHLNKDSYDYFNSYLNNKLSSKKIHIKKSKIFIEEKKNERNVIALSTINKINLTHNHKKNRNLIEIEGSIYNTNYHLNLIRDIFKKNTTDIEIKFKNLNSKVVNKFNTYSNKKYEHEGFTSIKFLGSEINLDYNIDKRLINLKSTKSKINNKDISLTGDINISPFYYNIKLNLESINIKKLQKYLPRIKNLLDEKILLSKNVNGKILLNIDSLKGIKFFDKAIINLSILNQKLILNDSIFISEKIGNMILKNGILEIIEDEKILKLDILFDVINEKKFFQKIQIPKSNRIKLKNIYIVLEKNFFNNEINIFKFIINKKTQNSSLDEEIDLTENLDLDQFNNINNWIELKKFTTDLLSEAKKIN
tara:strand:+ start:7 stop:1557 length:1551 start_codon:yes stop_codon:yes gene_type:complete